MKRKLLNLCGALALTVLFGFSALAQGQPESRVRLSIAPNAKQVKFVVRLSEGAKSANISFGQGEDNSPIAYRPEGDNGMVIDYTFKKPSAEERQIVLDASELMTLRITKATKQINGILEVIAPRLEHLFGDYTSLEEHSSLDLSRAPRLKSLSMTYTGLEHVVLPKTNTLTSVAISPTLAEKTFLQTINVEAAPKLTQLAIGNHALPDTLDLRNNKELRVLGVAAGLDMGDKKRKKLRAILGIKDLTLERFYGQNNELGFDQLPNRPEEVPLEQFVYSNQRNYLLNKKYIQGLTVNLAHLYKAKGIQTAISLTNFEWVMDVKKGEKTEYVPIPNDKIKQKDGVFTFDESILIEGKRKVYFRMWNSGYPDVGRYIAKEKRYNHKLVSYAFTLEKKISHVVLATAVGAGAPISLRLVSRSGKVTIKVGSEQKEYEVSTDLQKATPLTLRSTEANPVVELDGELRLLACSDISLKSLDLSKARSLQVLDCSRSGLESLDASGCEDLVYLYAMDNELETVTLGQLPKLRELNLSFNSLTSIDFSGLPLLTNLTYDKNKVKQADFSHNPELRQLYCKSNGIESLSLKGLTNLTALSCESNKIKELDLTACTKLEKLYCKGNKLTALDLKANTTLVELNASANELKMLDLGGLTELKELYCWTNQIQKLDLTPCKKLEVVSAGDNQLTEVKAMALPVLNSLALSFNQLSALSVEGCAALMGVDVSFNKLSLAAADAFITSLPMRSADESGIVIYYNKQEFPDKPDQNQITPELASKAKAKHWVMRDGETPLPLGLHEVMQQKLSVFPTVASDYVQIRGAYTRGMLYRFDGVEASRLVGEQTTWSVGHLPEGSYLLRLWLPNGSAETFRIELRR
ncbi:MAG: hypothetical protein Q4A64_01150 [Porphyromonadaceae bacterium]|nr:hypothetical protein [Porphyromonadaceae bacterium]